MGDDYLSDGTVSHHHTPDCERRSLYVGLVSSGALSGRLGEMLSNLDVITHFDTSGGANSLALVRVRRIWASDVTELTSWRGSLAAGWLWLQSWDVFDLESRGRETIEVR